MDESIKPLIDAAKDSMEKSISHLESELTKIRAGKANPVMLDGVRVDYYGMMTPISGAGSVTVADARTLLIKPFEAKMISVIERAIMEANLGVTPQNNGIEIRIVIPALNEVRRKELAKQTKQEGEHAKIAIRNVRQDTNGKLSKKLKDKAISEDMQKDGEKRVQDITNEFIAKVDKILAVKEKEIMTI